jgi:two-component system phosphate regulon response regulator PhoB
VLGETRGARERVIVLLVRRADVWGMIDLRSSRLRPARILVVDPDASTRDRLRTILDIEGHLVEGVDGLTAARARLRSGGVDLVVTELRFADASGFDLLDDLDGPAVIVLTDVDHQTARLRSFRLGADDYIVKPFDGEELAARVSAILRRTSPERSDETIAFDDLEIDLRSRVVITNGTAIETTAKEFDLLAFLAAAPGRVYTRQQLLSAVWGSSTEWQQAGTVTEHVRRIRHKLLDAGGTDCIQTVRSVGYRFDRRAVSVDLVRMAAAVA